MGTDGDRPFLVISAACFVLHVVSIDMFTFAQTIRSLRLNANCLDTTQNEPVLNVP